MGLFNKNSSKTTTTTKNTSGTVSNGTYVLSASQQAAADAQRAINANAAKGTTVANDTGSKTNGTVTTYTPTAAKTSGTVSNGTYNLSASQQSAANSQKAMNAAAKAGTTVANDTGSATNGTVYTYNPQTSGYNNTGYGTNATVINSYNMPLTDAQAEAKAYQKYWDSTYGQEAIAAQDAKSQEQYNKNFKDGYYRSQAVADAINNDKPSATNGTIITHDNETGDKIVVPNGDYSKAYSVTAAQFNAANNAYKPVVDEYNTTANPYSYYQVLQNANKNYDAEGNLTNPVVDPEKDQPIIDKYDVASLLGTNLDTQLSYEELYGTDYYTNMYETISEILNQYGDTMSDELKAALESQLAKINAQFDEAARQYYIQYRTQMANMPEYLSRLGVTGGMSETAALGALNNYSSNLASSENERFSTLADVDTSYRQKIAENNQEVANQLANYYYQIQMQKLKNQREDEQLAYERQQAANELAYKYAALAAKSY